VLFLPESEDALTVRELSAQSLDKMLALLCDLDGTLVDNVYQHVLAWSEALGEQANDSLSGVFTGGLNERRASCGRVTPRNRAKQAVVTGARAWISH